MPDQAAIEETTVPQFLQTQLARPTQIMGVATSNVIGQWGGGPGPAGLGVRPAGDAPNLENYYFFLHYTEEESVQHVLIVNMRFYQYGLASQGVGSVFPYSAGFATDQLWILEPVANKPNTFRILNRTHNIYLYDNNPFKQEGPLSIDVLDKPGVDHQRYEWQFSVDNVLPT